MSDRTTVRRYEGREAGEQLDAFLPAYEEVYVEEPYCEGPREVAEAIERFKDQAATRDGFRVVVARDEDEVIGFTYGFLLPPGTGWWSGALDLLPENFTRETGDRTFAVIELAVRKSWRRQGVAARMHSELLEGLEVQRVTLSMRPEPTAAPAQTAYAQWGYRKIGPSRPWDEAPVYDLMVLDRP